MAGSGVVRSWAGHRDRTGRGTFKLSTDPNFEAKVADVVGLYLDPRVGAVVLSIDEKTQVQALDRTQPVLPIDFLRAPRHDEPVRRVGHRNWWGARRVFYQRRRTEEARSRVGEPAGTLRFRISRYGTTSPSAKPFKLRLT